MKPGGSWLWSGLPLLGLILAGCDGDGATAPPGGGDADVTLSVAVSVGSSIVGSASPAFDLILTDDANTLEITRAAVVLREIELELQNDDECEDDSGSGSSDDDCEFEVGPFLIELPLDGTVDRVITIDDVRPGVYDELEFDIHKPEDDSTEDAEFLQSFPEFRRVSILVEGSYNGEAFTYVTDLDEEQELDLSPPLVITEGSPAANVTLVLDIDSWFRRSDGSLVDPATANKGGPNEDLVEENIERSIEGFEDDDRDGEDD